PQSVRNPVRAKFDELREQADNALVRGEQMAARNSLSTIARSDLPKPYRAWAAARLLLLTPKTDAESNWPPDLRAALTPDLRDEWLFPPNGVPVTLGTLADRCLDREAAVAVVPTSTTLPTDQKPDDAAALSADAEIERTLHLAPGSAPLRWIP